MLETRIERGCGEENAGVGRHWTLPQPAVTEVTSLYLPDPIAHVLLSTYLHQMQYRNQRWMSRGCGSQAIHHPTKGRRPNRSKDLYAKVLIYGRGPSKSPLASLWALDAIARSVLGGEEHLDLGKRKITGDLSDQWAGRLTARGM